ncbi:flavin reductase family protein [Klebsiella pneumoniae subsp. pneumoniae]|nr:flavin reductase family protein [Klebsiella pneumoniae subsp. pneumoniae]
MSRFRHVELQYASRLLNHGPTILITSYDAPSDRRNVMAAAWSMPVEFAPPRVAIVVDKSTWTREIIERNGTFGIVVPGVAAASWTYAVGSVSGRDEDKFNAWDPGSNRSGAGAAADRGEMSGMDGVPVAAGDGGPDPVRHPVRGGGLCRRR